MALPFNLRDQFLDIIQTPACFQPQFMGPGMVGTGLCRLRNRFQTGTKRLIYHTPERRTHLFCNRSRPIQYIIVYG